MKLNMQKIVKYFNSLVLKALSNVKNKTSYYINLNSKISNFNKSLICFISILFLYLFYLSIPTLYDKSWIQSTIENKLLNDYKIEFSTSSNIIYNILPSPHFLVKNSKIFRNNSEEAGSISEIKRLKVFISQNNFFNKNKIAIKKIIIDQANFSIKKNDLSFLDKIIDEKFSSKKIIVKRSNLFFKNKANETVVIIKIPEAVLFHDKLNLLNSLNLKGEVFKIPFIFNFEKDFALSKERKIKVKANKLKMNVLNTSSKQSSNLIRGLNITTTMNSKIYSNYDIKDNLITFSSDNSRINNSNLEYKGNLSFDPFDFKLDVNLERYELSKILDIDSIIGELFKSRLLFNKNISTNISIKLLSNTNDEIFNSSIINFNAMNGKIDFNQTKLINDKIGFLEVDNSRFFFENDKLTLNADLKLDIQNSQNLFSFLQTPKKSRKSIKNISINLDFNFFDNKMTVNNLKIDDSENDDEMINIIEEFSFRDDYNANKTRRMINKLLSIYEG
tara:strand:+ start:705 stop:2213 length:1509 start_codon:yes stop_codon:yes gene_type:complete